MTIEWTSDAEPLDVIALARTLTANDVRFIFVGAVAAIAHGYSGSTEDADTVPEVDDDNLGRLAASLRTLDARLYAHPRRTDLRADGSPPELDDLDLDDPASFRRHLTWQFSTSAGLLDVLLLIDAAGDYRELSRGAVEKEIAGVTVLVASLEDLIESKETVARPKDLAALDELRALLSERDTPGTA